MTQTSEGWSLHWLWFDHIWLVLLQSKPQVHDNAMFYGVRLWNLPFIKPCGCSNLNEGECSIQMKYWMMNHIMFLLWMMGAVQLLKQTATNINSINIPIKNSWRKDGKVYEPTCRPLYAVFTTTISNKWVYKFIWCISVKE